MLLELIVEASSTNMVADCGLVEEVEVSSASHQLTISDVVELSCLPAPLSESIGRLELLSLEDGSEIRLIGEDIVAMAEKRAPILKRLGLAASHQTITIKTAAAQRQDTKAAKNCFIVKKALTEGRLISEDDLLQTSCRKDAVQNSTVYFDRHNNVLRAAEPLMERSYIGRVLPNNDMLADTGGRLQLSVDLGGVFITRDVEALEVVGAQNRVHVRDAEGDVFIAPADLLSRGGDDEEF